MAEPTPEERKAQEDALVALVKRSLTEWTEEETKRRTEAKPKSVFGQIGELFS